MNTLNFGSFDRLQLHGVIQAPQNTFDLLDFDGPQASTFCNITKFCPLITRD